jgi:lipopolysaccharide/colanic/teichoic acid biosynthesis glycosyltransferase
MSSIDQSGLLSVSASKSGSTWTLVAKRVLDTILSLLLLICLCWLFAICALAVMLSSRGPVFFRQQRVGKGGQTFTMLKFRSMYVHTDSASHREYVTAFIQGQAAPQEGNGAPVYKLVHDARVTSVGRWLRRSSLDELPQLWNVLRGEMSLVGPRPPVPYEVALYPPSYMERFAVAPGITGLWQVCARSTASFEEMMALDLAYVRKQSFLLDLQILLKTVPAVCGSRGAH